MMFEVGQWVEDADHPDYQFLVTTVFEVSHEWYAGRVQVAEACIWVERLPDGVKVRRATEGNGWALGRSDKPITDPERIDELNLLVIKHKFRSAAS